MRNKLAQQAFRLLELQSHGVWAAGHRSEVLQASRQQQQQRQVRWASFQRGQKDWLQKANETRLKEEQKRGVQQNSHYSSNSENSQATFVAPEASAPAPVGACDLAMTTLDRANPKDPAKPSNDWPSTAQANVLTVSGHSSKQAAPATEISGAGEAADKVALQQDILHSGLVDQSSSVKVNPCLSMSKHQMHMSSSNKAFASSANVPLHAVV